MRDARHLVLSHVLLALTLEVQRDTLKRHVRTHGTAALALWTQDNEDLVAKAQRRACEACAKGKQRCDGHVPAPCSSCTNKGRHCVYRKSFVDDWDASNGPHASANSASPYHHGQNENFPCDAMDNATVNTIGTSDAITAQPYTCEDTAPVQPIVSHSLCASGPDLSWDDFPGPGSAQVLFSFSPAPALWAGASASLPFENSFLSTIDVPWDDLDTQHGLNAQTEAPASVGLVDTSLDLQGMSTEEEDILIAEHVPHVPSIPAETRARMLQALQDLLPQHQAHELCSRFPSLQHLDTYMQLYFEHCHPRMPFLHIPTFRPTPGLWEVVLGVVCIGSHHSSAISQQEHVAVLQQLVRYTLKRVVSIPVAQGTIPFLTLTGPTSIECQRLGLRAITAAFPP